MDVTSTHHVLSMKNEDIDDNWTTNPSFKVEREVKTLQPKRSASQLVRSKKLLELHKLREEQGVEMVALSRRTATFESLRHSDGSSNDMASSGVGSWQGKRSVKKELMKSNDEAHNS